MHSFRKKCFFQLNTVQVYAEAEMLQNLDGLVEANDFCT